MITNELIEKFGIDERYSKVRISGNKHEGDIIIDSLDLWVLKNHRWTINKNGYVVCTLHQGESMHRLVMKAEKGSICDHKNRNTTDNRKKNLRLVSHKENMRNRKASQTSLIPVKGVELSKNSWRVRIQYNGKTRNLGSYNDLYDAVCVRIRKEIELYKEMSVDYKSVLKRIPGSYLIFWFPEIYGKDNLKYFGTEFVTNFFIHKKEDNRGLRLKMIRYREFAYKSAYKEHKEKVGLN